MRISGIILGAFLTVGLVYASDHGLAPTGFQQRPMVNWDVVAGNIGELSARARHQWNRLTAG